MKSNRFYHIIADNEIVPESIRNSINVKSIMHELLPPAELYELKWRSLILKRKNLLSFAKNVWCSLARLKHFKHYLRNFAISLQLCLKLEQRGCKNFPAFLNNSQQPTEVSQSFSSFDESLFIGWRSSETEWKIFMSQPSITPFGRLLTTPTNRQSHGKDSKRCIRRNYANEWIFQAIARHVLSSHELVEMIFLCETRRRSRSIRWITQLT
jgi:hypothetical protein